MGDKDKTVFPPERNVSYFSPHVWISQGKIKKVHFLWIQATADFHGLENLDTEPQHDTAYVHAKD